MKHARLPLLILAASLFGLPAQAQAQAQTQTRGARDPSSAMARYREAYDAMGRGEWLKARELLLTLWNQSRTYDVAASLGQVEYHLLNFVAAARYMSFAIANVAPKERLANVERYKHALDEIRAWVGTVQVTVVQPGAQVRVDGQVVGDSPFDGEVFVSPGTHVIEVLVDSKPRARKTIAIAAGEHLTQRLTLRGSNGGSGLDGDIQSTSVTPVSSLAPAVVASQRGEEAEGAGRSLVPAYVGAGVAAVGTAMAIGFGIAANDAEEDAETLRSRLGANGCSTRSAAPADCQAAADAVDRQRRNAILSSVGIGVTAAAGLATLGYYLWPRGAEDRTRSASVGPSVALTTTSSSFFLSGEF